jgi:hypothetical protein
MKMFSLLWQYLTEFFIEWGMFRIKVVEEIKTHILCSVTFSRKSCCEIMSKNMKESERPQIAKWRRVACWTSKATRGKHTPAPVHPHPHTCTYTRSSTHLPMRATMRARTHTRVILITFPLHLWFRERVSALRYVYSACLATFRRPILVFS